MCNGAFEALFGAEAVTQCRNVAANRPRGAPKAESLQAIALNFHERGPNEVGFEEPSFATSVLCFHHC